MPSHMRVTLAVLVPFILSIQLAEGWGSGAPDPTTCVTMSPSHAGKQGASTAYAVQSSDDVYSPDKPITVTLKASKPFKGFSIQARAVGGEEPLGTFTPIDGSKIICESGKGNGITHSSSAEKNEMVFQWTPPKESQEQLVFMATFVECYRCEWFKTESVPIYPFGKEPIGPNDNKNKVADSGKKSPSADDRNSVNNSGPSHFQTVAYIWQLVSALFVFVTCAWVL